MGEPPGRWFEATASRKDRGRHILAFLNMSYRFGWHTREAAGSIGLNGWVLEGYQHGAILQ